MKFKKIAIFFVLMFACLSFGACDLSFTQSTKTLEVSGNVTFEGKALEGVSIKTKSQTLCKTNNLGKFTFTINANSIEIFAEKNGFTFSPRQVTISESVSNLSFVAEKIENLNGEIVLSSVNITPTSMASVPDDYNYANGSDEYLKIKNIKVQISNFEYKNFVPNKSIATKQTNNIFSTSEEYSIKTTEKFSILFSLSAYFTAYGHEYEYNETRLTTLNVAKTKTTANLNDNNQFEVSLYGINSSNNMFSYNITFVFDYYPNI